MEFDIIEDKSKKIGLFTDLHCGVEKDSSDRLKETEKCIDWIIKTFLNNKVNWIFFLGDLFDSRFSINTKSLNVGINCIEKLSKNFEKVFLILGNHDAFYKNTNEVNSIDFLEKISNNNNITIISQKPFYIKLAEKTLGLYPWRSESLLFNENNNIETCDSGKNALQMIGSPLQLNWSDFGLKKYVYILNVCNDTIIALDNTQNAIYNKIFYSKLEKNEYSSKKLMQMCSNNYIKLVIDEKYEFNKIINYLTLLKQYNMKSLETEYLISLSTTLMKNININSIEKNKSKSNLEYILDYIDTLYEDLSKVDKDIDKNKLINYAESYFAKIENK